MLSIEFMKYYERVILRKNINYQSRERLLTAFYIFHTN